MTEGGTLAPPPLGVGAAPPPSKVGASPPPPQQQLSDAGKGVPPLAHPPGALSPLPSELADVIDAVTAHTRAAVDVLGAGADVHGGGSGGTLEARDLLHRAADACLPTLPARLRARLCGHVVLCGGVARLGGAVLARLRGGLSASAYDGPVLVLGDPTGAEARERTRAAATSAAAQTTLRCATRRAPTAARCTSCPCTATSQRRWWTRPRRPRAASSCCPLATTARCARARRIWMCTTACSLLRV